MRQTTRRIARRIVIFGLLFGASCLLAPLAAGEPLGESPAALPSLWTRKAGVDWPCFLGPTGDSRSVEKGISKTWPEAGPKLVWQKRIGTSYGIGSVSRGRLFQFDRYGDKARLTCMKAETGEDIWTFDYTSGFEDLYGYNNGPRCSPVVDDDRVYVFGAEGMLHCLRCVDGKLIWKVDTGKQFNVVQNFFGVGSTPVVEGENLIVMVGGSPAKDLEIPPGQLDRVSGAGSGIVAFDKRTGEVRYRITDELASYASLKLATIDGRRWCFAFARGGLVGFEPATGKVDFEFPWRSKILESVNAATPVVVGSEVLISETYGPGAALVAVKPGDFKVIWKDDEGVRQKNMQCHWNTPVFHEGFLYGSSGRHTNNAVLKCIDWKTGKEQWSQPGLGRCSLLYVDGYFVCQSEMGPLLLIKADPTKFEVVAKTILRRETGGAVLTGDLAPPLLKPPCWAAPILSHGLLYVRGDGVLACLELIPEPAAGK